VIERILSQLQTYETFGLKELDAADLLERKDFKYIFHIKDLSLILDIVKPYYKVLSVNGDLTTDYETKYFDTKDFKFYTQHHNGQTNRYKIRLRKYVQSALFFYEEKFKNNKNWTQKNRIKVTSDNIDVNEYAKAIHNERLEYKLNVNYTRITMISKQFGEKITFDLNLKYFNDNQEKSFSEICIAEVKSKTHHPHIFRKEIKKLGYSDMGLSKYCFGIANLYKQLKSNNFKPSFIYINKILATNKITSK
jgi:hypothetical protein